MLNGTNLFRTLIIILFLSSTIFSQILEWQQTNGPYGGLTRSYASAPNGDMYIYAGFSVFKSIDNGANWIKVNLTTNDADGAIAINSSGNIFVSDENKIHKSIDNGTTWTTQIIGNNTYTSNLIIDSRDIIYLSNNNVFISSSDGGITWVNSTVIPSGWINDLFVQSQSNIFAATNKGIYSSTDGGMNWIQLPTEEIFYFSVIESNGNLVAGAENKIYRSSDTGLTWNIVYNGVRNFYHLAVDSSGNIWASDNTDLLKSSDGINWSVIQRMNPGYEMAYFMQITKAGDIYTGNDNGLMILKNNGNTIEILNNGIIGSYINGISGSNSGTIFTSLNRYIYSSEDKGNSWQKTTVNSFLPGTTPGVIKAYGNNIYYGDHVSLGISSDNGVTWFKSIFDANTSVKDIAVGTGGKVVIASENETFMSNNSGLTWKKIKTWNDNYWNTNIAVSRYGEILQTRNDGLYQSSNDGTIWNKLTSGDNQFTDVLITRKGYIIASCTPGVYISKDNGITWDIKYVSQSEINPSILLEAQNGNIYANTIYGLYLTNDEGNTWDWQGSSEDVGFAIQSLTIDNEGYLFAGTHYKSVYRTISPTIQILPPVSTATPRSNSAYITWNKNSSDNFQKYNIYGSTEHYPTTLIASVDVVEDTLRLLEGLTNNVPYYLVVSAVDNEGNESFSEEISVTPVPVPLTPQLNSVSNESHNVPISLNLKWSKTLYTSTYHLQVSTDQTFILVDIEDSTLTDTVKQISGLNNDTKYYWRVRSKGISGSSEWSDVWAFTTIIAAPSATLIVSPVSNAVNLPIDPVVTWGRLLDADTYHLQVSSSSLFEQLVLNDTTVVDTFKQVSLNNNVLYYSRVRGKNIGGYGQWSEVISFKTIVAIPGIPVLTTPANGGDKQSTDLRLTWTQVQNAESYRLVVSTDEAFANIVFEDSNITSVSKQVTGLLTGMKYYWKVKAKNVAGTGSYSAVWNFITVMLAPEKLTAENLDVEKALLSWENKNNNTSGFILERKTLNGSFAEVASLTENETSYTDSAIQAGTVYKYRVKAYTEFAESEYSNEVQVTPLSSVAENEIPTVYALNQNYPNPFNPSTVITYSIPFESQVSIKVYNMLGEQIAELVNEVKPIGFHNVSFNAADRASGIYFYSINAAATDGAKEYNTVMKMMLIK